MSQQCPNSVPKYDENEQTKENIKISSQIN